MPSKTTDALLSVRFQSKVDRSGDGCWEWQGARFKNGYGMMRVGGLQKKAHRIAFQLEHGREPVGSVCHHCDNPPCCRPDHLFEGTPRDNTQDGYRKGRIKVPPIEARTRYARSITHCPQGHPYNEVNTYRYRDRSRKCRICDRERHAARKAARTTTEEEWR